MEVPRVEAARRPQFPLPLVQEDGQLYLRGVLMVTVSVLAAMQEEGSVEAPRHGLHPMQALPTPVKSLRIRLPSERIHDCRPVPDLRGRQ